MPNQFICQIFWKIFLKDLHNWPGPNGVVAKQTAASTTIVIGKQSRDCIVGPSTFTFHTVRNDVQKMQPLRITIVCAGLVDTTFLHG